MSSIEPKKIHEALKDVDWVNATHKELNNFKKNQLWELVKRLMDHNVIGNQVSLLEQARSRWHSNKEQSKISGSRLHSS